MSYLRMSQQDKAKLYQQQHREFSNQQRVEQNTSPDEFRIQSILSAINRGKFKYYVKGGYCGSRLRHITPAKVAKENNLDVNECLFEIRDRRIEQAVAQNPNMTIIKTYTRKRENNVW